MRHPFITVCVGVQLRAKGSLVQLALGTLVDDGTLLPRKRYGLSVGFEEVLSHLRPNELKEKTQVAKQRIIAQNCPLVLQQIVNAQCGEANGERRPIPRHPFEPPTNNQADRNRDRKCQSGITNFSVHVSLLLVRSFL